MWIESDKTARANTCVNGVCHESFTETGDNKVIVDIGECRKVARRLETLMHTHSCGRFAVHDVRPLAL